MRQQFYIAVLAVFVGAGTLGCQSSPKLAWWKKSASDPSTNAVAHSAPPLPSEVARQNEGLAGGATPSTGTSSAPLYASAPAFNASATSEAPPYPSTGAPDYSQGIASNRSATSAAATSSSTMPYNPSAVPPPAQTASAPLQTNSVDRYGYASSGAPAVESGLGAGAPMTESAPFASTQSPLGPGGPSGSSGLAEARAVPQASGTSLDGMMSAPSYTGDRYATSTSTDTATQASSVDTGSGAHDGVVQQTTSLATAQPYRPGGTSSYPSTAGTQPSYEIATRPDSTSSGGTTPVPNVATPAPGSTQYR